MFNFLRLIFRLKWRSTARWRDAYALRLVRKVTRFPIGGWEDAWRRIIVGWCTTSVADLTISKDRPSNIVVALLQKEESWYVAVCQGHAFRFWVRSDSSAGWADWFRHNLNQSRPSSFSRAHTHTQVKTLALLAVLVASASAFAPAPFGARSATRLFSDQAYGKYDGKLWDNEGESPPRRRNSPATNPLPDRTMHAVKRLAPRSWSYPLFS